MLFFGNMRMSKLKNENVCSNNFEVWSCIFDMWEFCNSEILKLGNFLGPFYYHVLTVSIKLLLVGLFRGILRSLQSIVLR